MKFARNPIQDYSKPSTPKENPSFSEYFGQVGEKPPATIVEDGNIHRYGTKKHRWYVFTKGSDGWDHGAFGDWSTGNTYTWTSRGSGAKLTPKEIAAIEEQNRRIEEERKAVQEQAAKEAREYFENLPYATLENPYIKKKNIHAPYGAKADGNRLVVPVFGEDGEIMSLQTIPADGKEKRFFPNARTKCGWYCVGPMDDLSKVKYMAEGFATAASIYEATGKSCIVAFSASNLKRVKDFLEGLDLRVVMDNDESKTGEVEGLKADPNGILIPEVGMDANDYASAYGFKALKDILEPEQDKPFVELFQPNDFMEKPKDNAYLIKHWWPAGPALGMTYGASGSGKTFVVLDRMLSIASGKEEWFGQKIKRSRVLYICGEGVNSFRKRATVWCQEKGVSSSDLDGWFMWTKVATSIDDNIQLQKTIDSIDSYGFRPELIVVDTMNKAMVGDENSTKDATRFIVNCTYLENMYNALVVLVHHTGLAQDAQDRARGNSAFRGALDVQDMVKCEDDVISISQVKNKDEEPCESVCAVLEDHHIESWGYDIDGEPYEGAILVRTDTTNGEQKVQSIGKKSLSEKKFCEMASKLVTYPDTKGCVSVRRSDVEDYLNSKYEEKNPFDPNGSIKYTQYTKNRNRSTRRCFEDGFIAALMNEDGPSYMKKLSESNGMLVYNECPDRNGIRRFTFSSNVKRGFENVCQDYIEEVENVEF